jgi:hypothetical protein
MRPEPGSDLTAPFCVAKQHRVCACVCVSVRNLYVKFFLLTVFYQQSSIYLLVNGWFNHDESLNVGEYAAI